MNLLQGLPELYSESSLWSRVSLGAPMGNSLLNVLCTCFDPLVVLAILTHSLAHQTRVYLQAPCIRSFYYAPGAERSASWCQAVSAFRLSAMFQSCGPLRQTAVI